MVKYPNLLRLFSVAIVVVCVSTVRAQKIYWVDPGTDKIQRANLDGSGVEDLIISGLLDPNDIALDLVNNKMYWTDHGTQSIRRANLDGTTIEDLLTNAADGIDTPKGIALDVAGGKMYWADIFKIQRANLDGSTVELLYESCHGLIAPQGVALDITGGKIYWTDSGTDKIQRGNMDGTTFPAEDLVATGLSLPGSIALDLVNLPNKMYWMDSGLNLIRRANLDGTNIQGVAGPNLNDPFGLDLDTAGGKIYWTEATPAIDRANLDGTEVETLVDFNFLSDPRAVALDLFAACCTGGTCTVEDRQVCADGGGFWLEGIPDCLTNPCDLGACCTIAGTLVSCDDNEGLMMDEATCLGLPGTPTYVGGVTCDFDPCSACSFDTPSNCQQVQTIFGTVPLMDRNPQNGSNNGTLATVLADDVKFGGTPVDQICWNTGFFATPCCGTTCVQNVDASWQIRIYGPDPSCDALPGIEIGMSTITVLNKVDGAGAATGNWHYSGSLDTPIVLPNPGLAGDTYWFEISEGVSNEHAEQGSKSHVTPQPTLAV